MIEMLIKLVPFITSFITLLIVVVIKFNDMKHLENTVNEIKVDVKDLYKTVNVDEQRISKIEGKMNGG